MTESGQQTPVHDPPTSAEIRELTGSVYDLSALITEHLSPGLKNVQDELQKKVGRRESKIRARRSVALVMTATLLALVSSVLFVIGIVVPKCFFTASPGSGPAACHVIPNYTRAVLRSKQQQQGFLDQQRRLAEETNEARRRQAINAPRLDRLERDVNDLRRRLGLPLEKPLPLPPPLPR
jgi:hypothetical protein